MDHDDIPSTETAGCPPPESASERALNEQMQAMARRFESRFRSIDGRIDATRSQVDHVRMQLSSKIDDWHTSLRSLICWTVVGGAVVVAVLCLVTIVILG